MGSVRMFTLITLVVLTAAPLAAAEESYHLALGDPDRRDREMPLVLDGITDARSGGLLDPGGLAQALDGVRVVFVGESHTDMDFHQAQLRVIQELHRQGREVLIGLEMFPYTSQEHLDRWIDGSYTEKGFLEQADWYESWGYHWHYYREIFHFARDNGLGMFAVNTPREVVRAVRTEGFDNLTEEQAAHIPPEIDVDNEDHFQLFRTLLESNEDAFHSSMSEEMWRGMFRAQCTWDATMGYNATQALLEHGGPEAIMVVLIGSGHVVYGLGIQRQAANWFDGPMASVIPITVRDSDGDPMETVRASYADFVWGVPPEEQPIYPILGLSTRELKEEERRSVIDVAEDSVAERAGFLVGDVLLTLDGESMATKGDISRYMAGKRWGDSGRATVRREGEELELELNFRRTLDEDDEKETEVAE